MVLTVYKLDASPPARAVMMAVEALGIQDVEYKDVNLMTGDHISEEYVAMNPQHTIPTVKDDDFAIWDSHAIVVYLFNKYGQDSSLYPSDIQKRAIVDQRLHFDTGILFPALRGSLEPILYRGETAFRPESFDKIASAYDFTEKFLTKTWIAGDDFTLADICCMATISSLHEIVPIDADKYPKITAWLSRCAEKPYYAKVNVPGVQALGALIRSKVTS